MDENNFLQAQERAGCCQMFSNAYRVLIVWALFNRELLVGGLAEEIQATLQNTSQHLRLMKDRGFVEARREGQNVYYKVADHPFFADCAILQQLRQANLF